ncbi:MAG TPA: hypothetical protein VFA49_14480, partial [Chloroflexota bacterium]|nr:hypothetical protein [Chloroflexota bacterium]
MNELLFLLRIAAGLAVLTLLFVLVRRRVGGLPLPGRGARPRLCPHLGLASDPFKHYPGANEEHRCYASLGRERVDLAHQRRFCLASSYGRCPFLTVKDGSNGPLERIWAWGRVVSPIPQAWAGIPRRPEGSPWAPSTAALMRELARQAVPLTIMAWATLVALLAGARERFSGARTSSPQPAMRLRMATASRSAMESMAGGVVAPAAPGMPVAAPATPIGPAMPIVPGMPVAQPAVPPIGQPMPSVVPGAPMPPVPPLHVALAAPGIAEPLQASMWEPVEHAAAAPMAEPRPAPVAAGLAEPPPAPVAAGMAMTDDGDLVDRGVLALERGDEAAAYRLFKQATDADPRELRAWFWRAKTAESLDEVISCLQRALALEPGSTQIKANLDWAIQRREQAKNPTVVVKPMSARRPHTSA